MSNSRVWDFVPGEPRYPPSLMSRLTTLSPWRRDSDFMVTFSKLLTDIRKIVNSKKGLPFILPGSSSFAVEFAVANLLEPDDVALVIGKGPSSEYLATIARSFANAVDLFSLPENVESLDQLLTAKLEEKPYKVVLVPHVEMSTGNLLPIEEVERVVREVKAYLVIDAHASIGAHPVPKADVITAGSNWALGSPPGLGVVLASERVIEERNGRTGKLPSRYLDMMTWISTMESYLACEVVPPASVPTILIQSLALTAGAIAKNLDQYQKNHSRFSRIFRTNLDKMGIELLQEDHELVARTFTVFRLPKEMKSGSFVSTAAKMGLRLDKTTKGKDTREVSVGHAGFLTDDDLLSLVFHLEEVLTNMGVVLKESGLVIAGDALRGKYNNQD